MATFNTGALGTATNHNFVSYYEAHEPDISNELVQRYANSMIGFLDFTNSKKSTDALEFSRFEKDRIMPKIKATTAGAGAGVQATFTLDASVQIDIPSAAPYDPTAAPDAKATTVRLNDLIMIKPASGTASYGTYVKAIVDGVTGYTSFTATPIDITASIPAIAAADEIVIYGNAHGEASGYQAPMSTKATKITEKLQIIKDTHRVTGSEGLTKKWFTQKSSGVAKFMVEGEGDSYARFMNTMDMNLLVGDELSSKTVADAFQATNNPIALTNGLLTQINGSGNILNYSSVSGLTIDDLYDYNVEIDKNKAQKNNIMMTGIILDQQVDQELGDRLKSGAITYGEFKGDAEKAVNLSFQKVTLGSYSYDKRCMESFNDIQTLGADGFGFPYEAFTLPSGSVKVAGGAEKGAKVASLRKRFLAGNGKSREMLVDYFNARTMSNEGYDYEEVRYLAHVAFEAQALNQFGYVKRV
jgi:hypothetical protein